jgi:phospholipid transport system substrate-binding protein
MDREYSARLVLARHARGATPEQIEAFASALTDNLLRRYGTALLDFDPDVDVRVKSETPLRDGKLVRVASEVLRKGGAPVPVDYLFRAVGDDDWKVFDVIVEGVSYVQTYRTQFDEQLRSQNLDQVTAKLRKGELQVDG